MYFVKGTTCTYCKTRAGTNFEAGREMKKKVAGIQCRVCWQSTGHYFIFGTFGTIIFTYIWCKAMFSDCYEIIPIGYGFNYGGTLKETWIIFFWGLWEQFLVNFRNSRQVHRTLLCFVEATYALVICCW